MAIDPARLMLEVGRRLSELRVQRDMTQAQLAECVGLSVPYLASIEAGRHNLTLRSIARLANALGVRPLEFMRTPRSRNARRPGRPKRRKRR